jgi:hypothetical protein
MVSFGCRKPPTDQIAVDTDTGKPPGGWLLQRGRYPALRRGSHDGHNLWVGGYGNANVRIYDDGIAEAYGCPTSQMKAKSRPARRRSSR